MSRLLFAAARGARIQINGFTATVPSWYDSHKWSSMHESVLRIHPDDEHLQYGPISTALRKRAEDGLLHTADIPYLHGKFDFAEDEGAAWDYAEWGPRRMFLLILAEALADEGM